MNCGQRLFLASAGAPVAAGSAPQTNQFEPVFCNGAEAAVAAVREACGADRPFAVVFLDMRMPPGPDGAWAAGRIREIDPQVEIVICTAYSDVDPLEISRRVPPEDKLFYLQKPFHPHEVRQMALALGEKRANEELRLTQVEDFDPLTGLANRARFLAHLKDAVRAARQDRPHAVRAVRRPRQLPAHQRRAGAHRGRRDDAQRGAAAAGNPAARRRRGQRIPA